MPSDKKSLRNFARSFRAKLPMEEISTGICHRLASLDLFQQAQVVLAFYPIPNRHEVNLLPLFDNTKHNNSKQWYLPRIIQTSHNALLKEADLNAMSFHRYHPGDTLTPQRFGVLEPSAQSPWLTPEIPIDLVILPGLTFSRDGHRLGYGQGYYDRFLRFLSSGIQKPRHVIGVCPDQLLVPKLPIDPWDERLDYVVTEKEVYSTKA
ncbi:MAG: 5-formyltetrahydrofolate cyclo-ligase [Vampirovibrionales bacterium]|nr:5-formyltetrahydrofolate cyclo-ligase [Vampirovibrionales bacterium]